MADTYLTPGHINPKIAIFGNSQHFNFYEEFNSLTLFNKYVPTTLLNTEMNLDFINVNFSGFRFRHIGDSTSSIGSFSFNYFSNNDHAGTSLFTATENGIFFNINAKGNAPILGNDFTIKSYVDNKVFDLTSNTSGELSISRLGGYPANSSVFLRGDGTWSNLSSIDINNGTTGQLNIARLQNYPANSSVFLRGDGTWSNLSSIDINNGTTGQLNIARLQNYPTNSSVFLRGDGTWTQLYSSFLYSNSNIDLRGYKIVDGASSLGFVNGTLEVSSGIIASRYYSYGWLNSGGGTGTSSGNNYYSIDCTNRIAASEFNATSSKKIKKIIPNLNIEALKQKFLNINFYQYNYIDKIDGQGDHYGVIAEDLSLIFPQFVDLEQERHIPNCIDEQGKMESIYFDSKEKHVYKFTHKLDLNQIDKNSKSIRLFIDGIFYKASIESIITGKLYVRFKSDDRTMVDEYLKNKQVIYVYGTYETCPTVEKNKLFEIGLILLQELLKEIN